MIRDIRGELECVRPTAQQILLTDFVAKSITAARVIRLTFPIPPQHRLEPTTKRAALLLPGGALPWLAPTKQSGRHRRRSTANIDPAWQRSSLCSSWAFLWDVAYGCFCPEADSRERQPSRHRGRGVRRPRMHQGSCRGTLLRHACRPPE